MKNTIFLYKKMEGWKPFTFEKIEDIQDEFSKRDITIGYDIQIGYDVFIGNNVKIGNKVLVGDGAKIGYGTQIGDRVIVGNSAIIGYGAKIADDAKILKTLYITGPKHPIFYWGENKINIGCRNYSIDDLKKQFKSIPESKGYTPEEIEEYREYIEFIAKIHKTWNINQ